MSAAGSTVNNTNVNIFITSQNKEEYESLISNTASPRRPMSGYVAGNTLLNTLDLDGNKIQG